MNEREKREAVHALIYSRVDLLPSTWTYGDSAPRKCRWCKWWVQDQEYVVPGGLRNRPFRGTCHRRAPTAHKITGLLGLEMTESRWPAVGSRAWCGDWEGRDDEPA